jgi:hypothetical protein
MDKKKKVSVELVNSTQLDDASKSIISGGKKSFSNNSKSSSYNSMTMKTKFCCCLIHSKAAKFLEMLLLIGAIIITCILFMIPIAAHIVGSLETVNITNENNLYLLQVHYCKIPSNLTLYYIVKFNAYMMAAECMTYYMYRLQPLL